MSKVLAAVLLVATLGAQAPAPRAPDSSAKPAAQDVLRHVIWRTDRSEAYAEAVALHRDKDDHLSERFLIVSPAKNHLVLTDVTSLRAEGTVVELRDEASGWSATYRSHSGLDLGPSATFDSDAVVAFAARLRKENPWVDTSLRVHGGYKFDVRSRALDPTPAEAVLLRQARDANLGASLPDSVVEGLAFLAAARGIGPPGSGLRTAPGAATLLKLLEGCLAKTSAATTARAYKAAQWEFWESPRKPVSEPRSSAERDIVDQFSTVSRGDLFEDSRPHS